VYVDAALRLRIKELAATRVRYGQRRIYAPLRREGWCVNIRRVARIHRAEACQFGQKRHGTGALWSFAGSPQPPFRGRPRDNNWG
jgi:putative transposase